MLWNGGHLGARSRRSVLVTLDNLEIPSVQFWRGRDKIYFGYLSVTLGILGFSWNNFGRTVKNFGHFGLFGFIG